MQDASITNVLVERENLPHRRLGERAYISDFTNRHKWLNPGVYIPGELVLIKRSTEEWRYAEVISIALDGVRLRVGPGLTKVVPTRMLASHLGKIPYPRSMRVETSARVDTPINNAEVPRSYIRSMVQEAEDHDGISNNVVRNVDTPNYHEAHENLALRGHISESRAPLNKQRPSTNVTSFVCNCSVKVERKSMCARCKSLVASPQGKLDTVKAYLKKTKQESPKSQVENCPICLEPMEKGKALFAPECGHLYHFSCIRENVSHGNLSCPLCRHQLKEQPILLSP